MLSDVGEVVAPKVAPHSVPVWHLYVVRVNDRDRVLNELGQNGIGCGIHYPIPVHRQAAYASLGVGPGSLPVTERCAGEILSLPMFPGLTAGQIETVVHKLKSIVRLGRPVATAV